MWYPCSGAPRGAKISTSLQAALLQLHPAIYVLLISIGINSRMDSRRSKRFENGSVKRLCSSAQTYRHP